VSHIATNMGSPLKLVNDVRTKAGRIADSSR
jgi:hypothetical protein